MDSLFKLAVRKPFSTRKSNRGLSLHSRKLILFLFFLARAESLLTATLDLHSQYTSYRVTNTPYGKDIVKMLSDACQKDGMPLGFYYSPPDMHNPNFRDTSKPASVNWHGEPERPQWPLYLQYLQLQVTELLTLYGPVAVVWFDGLNDQAKYDGQRVVSMIHDLQPQTLVNDRIGVPGDYETPEQFIPTRIPTRGIKISGIDASASDQLKNGVPPPQDFQLWETCMTINNTMEKLLVTRKEAAAMLGLSVATVESLCKSGQLPFVRIGRNSRISTLALNEFCKTGTKNKTAKGRLLDQLWIGKGAE